MERAHTPTAAPAHAGASSATLWALRLLVRGGILSRLVRNGKDLQDDVRRTIEMPELDSASDEATLRARLAARLAEVEAIGARDEGVVFRNLDALGRLFQLAPLEREVLGLAAAMDDDTGLKECLKQTGPTRDLYRLCAVALARSRAEVSHALRRSGTLRATRLVDVKPGSRYEPLIILDGLDDVLLREHRTAASLVGTFVARAARAKLGPEDFAHMADAVELVTSVVGGALRRRAKGVNVLIYGPSGVGKTELVRVIAKSLDAPLYQVSDEDSDGDSMSGSGRLGACALAMRLLARTRRALLVFDEAEDAFPWESFAWGPRQRSTSEKSWTHRLLESSRVPTFWVTNQVEQIDAATLRRFDVAIEMLPPPRALRQRLLEARLGRAGVSAEWIARSAADDRLTPANVDQVTRVARLVGKRKPERLESALTQVLETSLALGGRSRTGGVTQLGPAPYDLRYSNASADLEAVARSLAARPRGALCLYGPPGTGKSAFAAHIADRAGKPLLAVRASDLLGMYVGQTEQNLARVFRRAARERSVLLLDEADSFLQDRTRAQHGWEVTAVNELLVQMESFEGLLVCATNLIDALDQASLRRFALKIRFDPLTADQAFALLRAATSSPAGEEDARASLARMRGLTPGDFAAVTRRLRMLEQPVTADALTAGLREELALKRSGGNVVGFCA